MEEVHPGVEPRVEPGGGARVEPGQIREEIQGWIQGSIQRISMWSWVESDLNADFNSDESLLAKAKHCEPEAQNEAGPLFQGLVAPSAVCGLQTYD